MFKFYEYVAFLYIFFFQFPYNSCKFLKQININQKCSINSFINAVDNVREDTYNLLVTLSTDAGNDCELSCKIFDEKNEIKKIQQYDFSGRHYEFFSFVDLIKYKNYKYDCSNNFAENSDNFYKVIFPRKISNETNITVFGDWSKCEDGEKTFKFLENNYNKYDLALLLGDYAYNLHDDSDMSWNNGDSFLKWIIPITSKIPFMLSAGNHEFYKGEFEHYSKGFKMPNADNTHNLYYSFDLNDAHFVSITSEFPLIKYKGTKYLDLFIKWFKKDLQKSDKKWKIVYMHRPIYCSYLTYKTPRCTTEASKLRDFFEDLFYSAKVDIVLAGHLHNYERMYPTYNGEIDALSINEEKNMYYKPKYPTYVVCGSSGNKEGHTENCKKK